MDFGLQSFGQFCAVSTLQAQGGNRLAQYETNPPSWQRELRPARHQFGRPANCHRDAWQLGRDREPCGALVEFVYMIIAKAMPLSEYANTITMIDDSERSANRPTPAGTVNHDIFGALERKSK